MGKKRKQLTHAEIWDDSALVNSWNDALEEYQFYHSIHARGERVEDVLKQIEGEGSADDATDGQPVPLSQANGHDSAEIEEEEELDELEDGELDEADGQVGSTSADYNQAEQPAERTQQTLPAMEAGPEGSISASNSVPATVLNNVKDDSLKNLMMSWYYAGYYTGLHEGQQMAKQAQK